MSVFVAEFRKDKFKSFQFVRSTDVFPMWIVGAGVAIEAIGIAVVATLLLRKRKITKKSHRAFKMSTSLIGPSRSIFGFLDVKSTILDS